MSTLDSKKTSPLQDSSRLDIAQVLPNLRLRSHAEHRLSLDGSEITIDRDTAELIVDVLDRLSRGDGVMVSSLSKTMTTSQVGDFLGVSRPYVVKLLEQGVMPFESVGTHRRVHVSDVLAYDELRRLDREKALNEIARISRKNGMYADDF